MVRYGQIVKARISDKNERHFFAQYEGETFTVLPGQIDIQNYQVGDQVEGLIYETKARKKVIQVDLPAIRPEVYGWGSVVSTRKDLGVFVDIGLQDKEVVVSLDDLPLNTALWPKKGDQLYIRLEVDKKDRIWGLLAYQEDFQRLARPAYNNMQNQNWSAIVYRLKLSGTFVYLPENNMLGFIHPSERYAEPRLGQVLDARVIGFREVDRTLNLSLKPRSFEMLENDAQMILTYLESNGGFMTLNDKSSPEDIKATFGISKGQFKKALGGLMKAGKIKQDQFGTELI